MKIKQHLIITHPADFFRGNYGSCFNLYETDSSTVDDWIDVGEIEIEVPDELVEKSQSVAIDALEKAKQAIKDQYAKDIIRIETARAELLCLTDQSAA